MKIMIVDDHEMFREGLVTLLGKDPEMQIVGQASTTQEAIRQARELHPEVVLMDFSLPDGTGVDATRAILAESPDTRILFLTVYEGEERLFAALRAGAKGYLLKNLPMAKLIESLRAIEKNQAAISPEMTWQVLTEFSKKEAPSAAMKSSISHLTLRELDVLKELAFFSTNAEIALRLSLSETTVKNHMHAILKKLQLKNRREAAWFAQEQGFGKKIL